MSVMKYKFVSPGVFVHEVDNSQIPDVTPDRGPVIIGRTRRGPSMRPITVNSFSEYIEKFGDPVPGGEGGDVWRNGNYSSPMYATYAAEAWLRNGNQATVLRLLGSEHSDKTTGHAGWRLSSTSASYGLFLIDSGSKDSTSLTGTLAAVWYFAGGTDDVRNTITLSGTIRASSGYTGANQTTASNACFIDTSGDSYQMSAIITSGSNVHTVYTGDAANPVPAGAQKVTFNFDPDSDKYIRKVFNTNPILTNAAMTDSTNVVNYWLGHTFERSIKKHVSGSAGGQAHGVMLRLGNVSNVEGGFESNFADFRTGAKSARTGFIFSQDLNAATGGSATDAATVDFDPSADTTNLFQFHARDGGEWENRNIKISIKDIKSSPNDDTNPYGTFTVLIRRAADTDNAVQILEQYSNCNLNPRSENYIARRIGDAFSTWDDIERRFRHYGEYPNISKFVRVEMNNDVNMGQADPRLLPFGFFGPPVPRPFSLHSKPGDGLRHQVTFPTADSDSPRPASFATSSVGVTDSEGVAGSGLVNSVFPGSGDIYSGPCGFSTSSFVYPNIVLRNNSSDAFLGRDRDAYFGYDSRRDTGTNTQFDPSNIDVLRALPGNASHSGTGSVEPSMVFTLDDLTVDGSGGTAVATWSSGSRDAGISATALTGTYTSIIETHGFNRFTVPMFGGFDGWDITQTDPVANVLISGNEKTNYVFNTFRRALTACNDPEYVDFNLMVVPGVTNTSITDLMVSVCEERGDAMAIIDLPDVYTGPQEGIGNASFEDRVGTLSSVVDAFEARKKNSSYAATYYPWVQVRDSINNTSLWVPPSVVALGTFSHSDRVGELWFAPAGFNRGGLSQGSSGLVVTNVSERLTSENRDDLYAANINPIASFPNEGIVIFGQKTLDATTSALSRINVRRLLIFLKKEISRLANQVLFDQNVPATWGRFKGLVTPLLESVKVRFGLTDYRLVLDETTTTPDLIDRNIMYAKIYLKPARAIEFIALDFVITSTGAAFED